MKTKEYWAGIMVDPGSEFTSFDAIAEAIQKDATDTLRAELEKVSLAHDKVCHQLHHIQVEHAKLTTELEKVKGELGEALKWKEEDPRMLREQIRVADVAFNHLHAEHSKLTTALDAERKITKSLRDQLADPPPDVQELVIKKCNLVSAEALDTERARVEVMRELLERPTPNMHTTETCKWFSDRDALLKSPDAPNVLLERLREAEREVSCCKRAIRLFMESCYTDADNYVGGIYKLKFEDILSATSPTTNDNRRGE